VRTSRTSTLDSGYVCAASTVEQTSAVQSNNAVRHFIANSPVVNDR
jgi:hypothetical protein